MLVRIVKDSDKKVRLIIWVQSCLDGLHEKNLEETGENGDCYKKKPLAIIHCKMEIRVSGVVCLQTSVKSLFSYWQESVEIIRASCSTSTASL